MKKQFWIMPAMVFLLALAAVIYINMQDITPEKMVFAIDIASLTGISEAEAVTLLDNRRAEFDACLENESLPPPGGVLRIERGNGAVIFVLAEKYGSYTQYLAYGEAEEEYTSKGERGYNLGAHRGNWKGAGHTVSTTSPNLPCRQVCLCGRQPNRCSAQALKLQPRRAVCALKRITRPTPPGGPRAVRRAGDA